MDYAKLQEIQTAIVNTAIFNSTNVILGQDFEISTRRLPMCIIKQGPGNVNSTESKFTVHVMALFYDATNIEKTICDNLRTIVLALRQIQAVVPGFYTTDSDILQPFGIVIEPVQPFGGFRLDCEVTTYL